MHHILTESQVNWFVKGMNGPTVSEQRLDWTTVSLNTTLPVQKSIQDLRIRSKDQEETYVTGTLDAARKICHFLTTKFGGNKTALKKKTAYDTYFLYDNRDPHVTTKTASELLEFTWRTMGEWYLKHEHQIFEKAASTDVENDVSATGNHEVDVILFDH